MFAFSKFLLQPFVYGMFAVLRTVVCIDLFFFLYV
uniref:Uncharacterized protein n=1 Tax=Rhizophora mucronata TaxID=61149 RepID=A0A2P2PHC6_RHIMU